MDVKNRHNREPKVRSVPPEKISWDIFFPMFRENTGIARSASAFTKEPVRNGSGS